MITNSFLNYYITSITTLISQLEIAVNVTDKMPEPFKGDGSGWMVDVIGPLAGTPLPLVVRLSGTGMEGLSTRCAEMDEYLRQTIVRQHFSSVYVTRMS